MSKNLQILAGVTLATGFVAGIAHGAYKVGKLNGRIEAWNIIKNELTTQLDELNSRKG